jgi:hypothetical protein
MTRQRMYATASCWHSIIDEFKKKFLKEAIERQDELIKKYLGLHRSETIPQKYKLQVRRIYKEELED